MTTFLPIFPLELVVYPGERVNLHIFEPRYIQLIQECISQNKLFGIPCVQNGKIAELGTSVRILDVAKTYDNGEMDIHSQGEDVFRILEIIDQVPEKLYKGAIVSFPKNVLENSDTQIASLIEREVKNLYELLSIEDKLPQALTNPSAYHMAHYIGLSMEQEYEVLNLFEEVQRLEYIRRHLVAMGPVLEELKIIKERVKLNGHFRNLTLDI